MAAANLLNIEKVSKSFGRAPLLDEVSLGVQVGDRIGVVGRNGGGKSTLLKVMTGLEPADSGRVTMGNDVRVGVLSQAAEIDSSQIVRDFLVGDRPEHEWMSDRRTRDCLNALLGGFEEVRLDRPISQLSGGERRRVEPWPGSRVPIGPPGGDESSDRFNPTDRKVGPWPLPRRTYATP